ncbi:MAG: lytic transglycosylase domain-containing protein [Pseudoxanthomonas sp.]
MRRLVPLLFSLMLAGQASAGTVYRCVGSDGIPNYSSKRVSGAVCTAVAHSAPSRLSSFTSKAAARPDPVREPAVAAAPAALPANDSPATPSAARTQQVVFQTTAAGATELPQRSAAGARVMRGAVYRFEKDGMTHYTNVRPRGAAQAKLLFSYVQTCYACGLLPGVNFGNVALNTSAFSNEIHMASQLYGVDEAVVRAIIHAESAYRPNALSHAGAQGLMQLIPATASRFGVSDPFDPAQNIRGGVQYLAWLMKRYSSNLTLVSAAYNAGEGAVDRNGGVPPYSETQRYVLRVGQLADRYRSALARN